MTKKELEYLMQEGEGYNLEFKESYNPNLAREICAMANATGGKILIGVTDDGKIKPINISNKLRSEIMDLVRNFDPSLKVIIEEAEGVIIINVPEGNEKPYSTGGKFFLRHGANSQQLSRSEIRDFFTKEGLIAFDDQLNKDFDIKKHLDPKVFKKFLEMTRISKMLPVDTLLENLSLVKDGKMKNAGVLIFSKEVTKFFLHATINCVFFRGKERSTILDREEYNFDLNTNYEKAFNFVQSKINTEYIIKGGPRQEVLELPEDALREAILNAIVHRDYFVKGANIQINVYSDRVEIINPGGLVKGMSIEDLGKKSITRNNLLFGLMQRMDLVEKSGTGYLRIKKALKKYKMSEPIIETNEHWFTITFKRPDLQKMTMRERLEGDITTQKTGQKTDQKILALIKENPYMGREELSKKLGNITESGVKYNLNKLKKNGAIKRIGPDKGGYWEVLK